MAPNRAAPLMCNPHLVRRLSTLAAAALLTAALPAQSTTTRVSTDSAGLQSNGLSNQASVSASGRFVAFTSKASNLVPGDTNGVNDVFVKDRQTGQTTRISVDSAGLQGNDESRGPTLSNDGRYVAFESYATNLVVGDTNGNPDIFLHDRQTGQTRRVSLNSLGQQANGYSFSASISGDGLFVAFESAATNLVAGDTNGFEDVFVFDRTTSQTTRVSVDSAGVQANLFSLDPSLSGDGRFVAFHSGANNLVPADTNGATDVFLHDRQTGNTKRVSLNSLGAQCNGYSDSSVVSADGSLIAFDSSATDLVLGDTNGFRDVFLHDRLTGKTTRVSVDSAGTQSDRHSFDPSLAANNRFVAFASLATNLVPGDTNAAQDVFLHDLQTGETLRLSVDAAGAQSNGESSNAARSLSDDGRFAAFSSAATNLVTADTNAALDVFLRDRGAVQLALTATGTCPGTVSLVITGASPDRSVAIVYGRAGTYVKPGSPCAGMVLGISRINLAGTFVTDAVGTAVWTSSVPPILCGLTFQGVDVFTCRTTNTIVL